MQVTIEGVINSDVCERDAQLTVEWTPFVQALARNGIVRIVGWPEPEPAPEPARKPRRARRTEGDE
ncbi:hypothetical protein [Nocardia cyriacigeorgica]|uniref:hypothetical protein n=1 Tax=Nocardia cyriacigeorgica TaxID=135487 RepID=UPI001893CB01|nr:hypothetical protein [Nocardia cyriacigeorgica]MBF6416989.1 hypothetical protein [Nocardia cyriacigeorgica]